MSNHSGSYMLNAVLHKLDEHAVFDTIGKEKTRELVADIVKISWDHDCNPGEILDGMGERVGYCHYCGQPADDFVEDICLNCTQTFGS